MAVSRPCVWTSATTTKFLPPAVSTTDPRNEDRAGLNSCRNRTTCFCARKGVSSGGAIVSTVVPFSLTIASLILRSS
jgi:hypothetical protein